MTVFPTPAAWSSLTVDKEQRIKCIYEWVKVGHINLREFRQLIEEEIEREKGMEP